MSEELAPLKKRTIAVRNKAEAVHRLTASLEDVVNVRSDWLDDKRGELARAIEAHTQLTAAKADASKLRYARNRVQMLRKVVNALEAGFIPIPTFHGEEVNMSIDQLPIKALVAFNDANASALFDEVRIIRGAPPKKAGGIVHTKQSRPDPLLVGVIKMKATTVSVYRRHYDWRAGQTVTRGTHRRLPEREQHFLVCWWRPTDETDDDMW